jgi:hypothetical protein
MLARIQATTGHLNAASVWSLDPGFPSRRDPVITVSKVKRR